MSKNLSYIIIASLILLNVIRAGAAEDTQESIYRMMFALINTLFLGIILVGVKLDSILEELRATRKGRD